MNSVTVPRFDPEDSPFRHEQVSGEDFSNESWGELDFEDVTFTSCRFTMTQVLDCSFERVTFVDCEITGLSFLRCRFVDCAISSSKADTSLVFVDCRLAQLQMAEVRVD